MDVARPDATRISAADLRQFVTDLYEAHGTPSDRAARVATSVVAANLHGHDSHGLQLLSWYVDSIESGTVDVDADPVVDRPTDYCVRVDPNGSIGRIVAATLTEHVIDLAAERGLAMGTTANSDHLGRLGEWAALAADADLMLIGFTKAFGNYVAPPGTTDGRYGSNPITAGIPTFDALSYPLLVDTSTSVVANAKLTELDRWGESVPAGWGLTADGAPLTDPADFLDGDGVLQPLGGRVAGHKGFALATMVELVATILADGHAAGQHVPVPQTNTTTFVAIDPLALTERTAIEAKLTAYAEYVQSADPGAVPLGRAAVGDRALLPGEAEHRIAADRRERGIPLPEATITALDRLGADHDLSIRP